MIYKNDPYYPAFAAPYAWRALRDAYRASTPRWALRWTLDATGTARAAPLYLRDVEAYLQECWDGGPDAVEGSVEAPGG